MGLRKIPGSDPWVYQCKVNGKSWARSTGQADRRKAQKEVPRLRREAQLHREQPDDLPRLSNAIVLEVARIEEDISPGQAYRVSYGLINFRKFAGDVRLEEIDTELVERYQRKRLKTAAKSTVSKELDFILRLLRLRGFDVRRPGPKPGKETEQREFTSDELERFFKVCPTRLKTLYAFLLCTGARLADVVPSPYSTHKALLKEEGY